MQIERSSHCGNDAWDERIVKRTQHSLPRRELVERICRRQEHLSYDDVVLAINLILAVIAEHLEHGGRVEIRKFGTFTTRLRRARRGRNPKTGQRVDVPARRVPRFSASPLLLSVLKQTRLNANMQ